MMTERRVAARTRRLFRSRTLIITLVLQPSERLLRGRMEPFLESFQWSVCNLLKRIPFLKNATLENLTWLVQINTLSSNHTRSHTDHLFLKSLFECHESSFQDWERGKKKKNQKRVSQDIWGPLLLVWKVNWCLKQNNQEIPCLWTVCTFWKGLLGIE